MLVERFQGFASEVLMHSVHELMGRQRPIRLDDGPLAVQPARLDGIEPGALHRQPTHQDPDPAGALHRLAITHIFPCSINGLLASLKGVSFCAEPFEGAPFRVILSGSNIDRGRNYNCPCGWSKMWVIASFTVRLCAPIHACTARLTCQAALSHTSTHTRLPSAPSRAAPQARKSVVTRLTGRPSTKRSSTRSWSVRNSP